MVLDKSFREFSKALAREEDARRREKDGYLRAIERSSEQQHREFSKALAREEDARRREKDGYLRAIERRLLSGGMA